MEDISDDFDSQELDFPFSGDTTSSEEFNFNSSQKNLMYEQINNEILKRENKRLKKQLVEIKFGDDFIGKRKSLLESKFPCINVQGKGINPGTLKTTH